MICRNAFVDPVIVDFRLEGHFPLFTVLPAASALDKGANIAFGVIMNTSW